MKRSFVSLLLTAAALSFAGVAHADALPVEACPPGANPGDACNTAGPDADEAGVCVARTCTSAPPDSGTTSFDCMLCELEGASSSSSGATSSSGAASSSGATSSSSGATASSSGGTSSSSGESASDDDGGCSVGGTGRDGLTGAAMCAVGALAYLASRRLKQS